jgi:hypothetical protein
LRVNREKQTVRHSAHLTFAPELRSYFLRRGVTISAAALATSLTVPATHAAPSELGASLAPAAFAAGTTGSVTLTAAKITIAIVLALLTIIGLFSSVVFRRKASISIPPSVSTFRGIGHLPGGQFISYASAVSGDGRGRVAIGKW